MKKVFNSLCIATALCLTAPAVAADDPMEKAVKARKGYMQVQAFNMGILGAMVKGEVEYDAAKATSAASNLKLLAQMDGGAMWPPGSGNDNSALKTRALPEIWSTWPAVGEKSQAFKDAAAAMADEAGLGAADMKSAFATLGKSCKGCHDDFRAAKK